MNSFSRASSSPDPRFGLVALTLLCLALAGCGPRPLTQSDDGPFAPGMSGDIAEAVDGLIVGHRLMAAGHFELALKAYYRAGAEQGLTADVLSAIGSANLRLGRLNQAERVLRKAVEEDPDFPASWNNLGVVLMERGKTAEAAEVFRTAFALDNGASDEIKRNLSLALAKRGDLAYTVENASEFDLVRRGNGRYLLLETPKSSEQ